jgi:hypothetical protein
MMDKKEAAMAAKDDIFNILVEPLLSEAAKRCNEHELGFMIIAEPNPNARYVWASTKVKVSRSLRQLIDQMKKKLGI